MPSREAKIAQLREMMNSVVANPKTYDLVEGRECGPQLKEDDSKSNKTDAFQRIVKMTSSRFRSERDVRNRLAKENYSSIEINEAIDRAIRCLLIDDERFGDVLIRSRIRQGKGRKGIESELLKEGIDLGSLPGWPEEYFTCSEDDEVERAFQLLKQKIIRSKNPRASAYRKLIQKGFTSSVAQSATKRWYEEH